MFSVETSCYNDNICDSRVSFLALNQNTWQDIVDNHTTHKVLFGKLYLFIHLPVQY